MSTQTSARPVCGEAPGRAETTPEATPAEWRARTLLALSVLNHRQSSAGLTLDDCEQLRRVLLGDWDGVAA